MTDSGNSISGRVVLQGEGAGAECRSRDIEKAVMVRNRSTTIARKEEEKIKGEKDGTQP